MTDHPTSLEGVYVDLDKGLSPQQVLERTEKGWVAGDPKPTGKTAGEIVAGQVFTFFNLVFLILGIVLMLAGSSFKNMGFLLVAFWNTAIGIVQQLRAKASLDKLSVVAIQPVSVIRDGIQTQIPPSELVRDDILVLTPGEQIPADGLLRQGLLRLDESLRTGESEPIVRREGDEVHSGAYVLSGGALVQLTAVGDQSFATRLSLEARANPEAKKSEMLLAMDKLIFYLGIAMIPIGILLFANEFWRLNNTMLDSVEATVAALVGMIPEGLYLLTSMALAASAVKLSFKKVLVQDMHCIETLARVDVLCLDKTGTITEPTISIQKQIPLSGVSENYLTDALNAFYHDTIPENDTARAMAAVYGKKSRWNCLDRVPFDPEYKWSAACFEDQGAFLVGAPDAILGRRYETYREQVEGYAAQGYRVLLVSAYNGDPRPNRLDADKLAPMALILLSSPIRADARETFDYFRQQGVHLRVLSGDDPATISRIAQEAGLPGADRCVDARRLETQEDYREAVENFAIFGRVTPEQKKYIVEALQQRGHTVAMVGDGVNDLLAMKQADCSVAMSSGVRAASQLASLVLLKSHFSAMPEIVAEGRRVINNIQRSAALYLVKNIFSIAIALAALLTGFSYPFIPVHLTVIGALTIGIPSFFLAMEPNYERVEGKFITNVLKRALPGGLTDFLTILLAQLLGRWMGLGAGEISTVCAVAISVTGMLVLYRVSQPFHTFRKILWGAMALGLVLSFTVFAGFLQWELGSFLAWLCMAVCCAAAVGIFLGIHRLEKKK